MRILIAEDDAVSRRILEVHLTKWGYQVVTARDGNEAWQILQSVDVPRLAILDWMMPGMDGVEVCRRVRKEAREPYTYLILLTTLNGVEDLVTGMNAGADDYLAKPYNANELRVRLRAGRRIVDLQEELIAARETLREKAGHDQMKQGELVLKHEQLTDMFRQVEQGKLEWEHTMDCIDDMVAMVDSERRIRRCNRAFIKLAGCTYAQLISTDWYELLQGAGLDLDGLAGLSGELFHEPSQRWLTLKTYPYDEGRGEVISLHDLTEIKLVSEQLTKAYEELKATHSQLLQQEKMASIGQLAAGVAHEINNPMGFISSNLGTMEKYLERLTGFLDLQSAGIEESAPQLLKEEIAQARRKFKVDYLIEDARSLLAESKDGAERVRTIVQNLKSFSRVDEAQSTYVDLNDCLERTVTIAWNELKYKTTLNRDYGELPRVKCLPQQLNQVFLNVLVNAAHAIEKQGEVTIRTRSELDQVSVAIHDTGCGIPEGIRNRIFEPFFTTKEVGKGTGLGLSISYDIIKKHGGTIDVESSETDGTTFTIRLPIEGV